MARKRRMSSTMRACPRCNTQPGRDQHGLPFVWKLHGSVSAIGTQFFPPGTMIPYSKTRAISKQYDRCSLVPSCYFLAAPNFFISQFTQIGNGNSSTSRQYVPSICLNVKTATGDAEFYTSLGLGCAGLHREQLPPTPQAALTSFKWQCRMNRELVTAN
jgi:hypothetical protein